MTLAAEDRVLLACCDSDPSDAALALLTDLTRGPLDWHYLVEAAVRHAMAPLLSHGLRLAQEADAGTHVPPVVDAELAAMKAHTARRNARLLGAAGDVVGALAAGGIPALALKDLQLVPDVYPDPALRPMGDVDLAVPREQYGDAVRILGGLGFEPVPAGARPFTERYAAGRQLRRAADEMWLDLQWHVGERAWDRHDDGAWNFDTAGLWSRAVPFRLAGQTLLAPCPEDMLVHLCAHLEGHRYCELVLFADLVALLHHHGDRFDWDRFVELTRSGQVTSEVFHVLLLAERLIGLPIPPGRLDELRPPYFEAPLAWPLFDNLTPLHLALDDAVAAGAPVALLDRLERLVRDQAARASRSFVVVDAFLRALREEGCGAVVATASPSPRVLPDECLPAFGDVEILVEDDSADLDGRVAAAAARSGFRAHGSSWRYEAEVTTTDPVLRDPLRPIRVDLVADRRPVRPRTLVAPKPRRSVAWQALTSRRRVAPTSLQVRLRCVSRAELLAALVADAGQRGPHRLFDAAHALGVIGDRDVAAGAHIIDGAPVADADLADGLEILAALGVPLVLGPESGPRVLEWARYGPAELDTAGDLRAAWFVAWTARQLGVSTGARYLAGALQPTSPLARIVAGGARAGLARLIRRRPDPPDARAHAYWLWPEPAPSESATEMLP